MSLLFTSMKTKGHPVSADAIMQGFVDWTAGAGLDTPLPGYASFGSRIAAAAGGQRLDLDRLADRMVQKLRKGGYIRLERNAWYLTDRGKNLRAEILATGTLSGLARDAD